MKLPLTVDSSYGDDGGRIIEVIDAKGNRADPFELVRRANAFDELLAFVHTTHALCLGNKHLDRDAEALMGKYET